MSVPLTMRAVDRVLVALEPDIATPAGAPSADTRPGSIPSAERTVMAAEVLASWFGASLQFVTTDAATTEQLDHLSGTIGLRTDPVLVLPAARFAQELNAHADSVAPSLVVASANPSSLAAAAAASQPCYLIPPGPKRRQPSGALVVALANGDDLDDPLALATVWAQALASPLTLVVADSPAARAQADRVRTRLEAMGLAVTLADSGTDLAAVLAAHDTTPLALVVGADRATGSEQVAQVLAAGCGVLVAPASTGPQHRQSVLELDAVHDLAAAIGDTSDDADGLDAEARQEVLDRAVVGRIGYVDHGWPVVVPVNFTSHEGDIFIRSVPGGKLEAALRNQRVCFETDIFSVEDRTGASVIVHGHLEVIGDPAALQAAWARDPSPWIDDEPMLWLRLVSLATTGRRVG